MRTLVIGCVAGVLAGCIAEPAQEVGIADLQPEWCNDDADQAQADCEESCADLPDPVADCLGPANDDLGQYFDEIVSAFEAIDPSVAGDVQSCIDSFDGLEDDCAQMRTKIYDGMASYGEVIAGFEALWSSLPCEGVAQLMRTVHWKEVSCIAKYRETLLSEYVDTVVLNLTLERLPLELLDWTWRAGSCNVTNWQRDVAYWSCMNLGCSGAHSRGFAQCRETCPAPAGTACVPDGYPAWADCGQWQWRFAWDNENNGSCDCVADPAPLNPFDNGICGKYDGEARKPFGTFNRSCDATSFSRFRNGSTGLWTLIVDHDFDGRGIGSTIGCIPNEQIAELEMRDSCDHAYDGVCEEGDICDDGTDLTDCRFGSP